MNIINISVDEKYLNWKNALDLHWFADNEFILTQPKNNIFLELLKVDTISGIAILKADKRIQLWSAPKLADTFAWLQLMQRIAVK